MGGARTTLIAMLAVMLCAPGCDDAHEAIGSQGAADEGPVSPDPEPEPRSGTDMGADWDVDAASDEDVDPAFDERVDPGDGQDIDIDAAVAEPPVVDQGVEAEDDWAVPDSFLGGGEWHLPEDREPDDTDPDTVELDPTAPELPRCGAFGPAEAVAAGPTLTASWLHGSPGVLFDEPALAGCRPARLWGGDPQRLWQEMTFEYIWGRVRHWAWRIHTLDGAGFDLHGEARYDGLGRVATATYDCVGAAAPEVYTFIYGPRERLLHVDVQRPAGCESMAAAIHEVRYRYGDDPKLPVARSVTLPGGRMAEIALAYERDAEGRVIAIREWTAAGDEGDRRTFEYDDAGRIVREVRSTVDDIGQRVDAEVEYTYDDEGRLVRRRMAEHLLEIGYDAAGDIEFVHATNPGLVQRLRFPDRSRLDHIGVDDDPVADGANGR